MSTQSADSVGVIKPAALLEHWQGHRRLTRRVIDAFREDRLFSFSIGGMRPFGALALEMITMS
ncbi:MAG: DinB family protein, partial [Longimicrobiales bacterium]